MRRGRLSGNKLGRSGLGRSAPVILAAVIGASLLSGCGLLSKPQPLRSDAPLTMSVTSPDFADDLMPARFTCHGKGESPPIFWSPAPAGTKSVAVVVDDSDAPIVPRVYWIVFDISPSTTDLQPGALPPHARTAYNSAGTATYDAPCPQGAPHNYRFTVYALNAYLGTTLSLHPQLLATWTAIARHVIARGTLTARALPAPAH